MKLVFMLLSVWSVILCMFAGCGGQRLPPGMPVLYPVTINITQKGEPVVEASVSLVADSTNENSQSAGGTTDSLGNVVIRTNGQFKGVPLGKWKVTVRKTELRYEKGYEPENIKIKATGDELADNKTRDRIAQDHSTVVLLTPKQYASADTSPLWVEVKKSSNKFELKLD